MYVVDCMKDVRTYLSLYGGLPYGEEQMWYLAIHHAWLMGHAPPMHTDWEEYLTAVLDVGLVPVTCGDLEYDLGAEWRSPVRVR
jgi:hypothetical protein